MVQFSGSGPEPLIVVDMLQYLYVGYLIIFLTSAPLTRSAIHLIINAWISAKTRQKKRGDM